MNLSENDIKRIVAAIKEDNCSCVFTTDEQDQIREAAKFARHMNKILSDSGKTVRETVIRIVITGLMGAILWGAVVVVKIKSGSI